MGLTTPSIQHRLGRLGENEATLGPYVGIGLEVVLWVFKVHAGDGGPVEHLLGEKLGTGPILVGPEASKGLTHYWVEGLLGPYRLIMPTR